MPVKLNGLLPPWPDFLTEVDQALTAPVELHCLGGFVLAILYGLPRPTDDLDYIEIRPRDAHPEMQELAGFGSKLCRKHKVFFQHIGAVADVPESYEDRLTSLDLGLSKLSLKILDPYDLALSKLRNSPKDREDVKLLAAKLKLSHATLMDRFNREMSWVANRERHETTLRWWREYFLD